MSKNGFHNSSDDQNSHKQTAAIYKHLSRDEFVKMIVGMIGAENFDKKEKPTDADLMLIAMAVFFYFKRSVVLNVKRTGRELFDDLYRQYLEEK